MNISIIIDNTNTLPAAKNLSTPPNSCVTDNSNANTSNSNSNNNNDNNNDNDRKTEISQPDP